MRVLHYCDDQTGRYRLQVLLHRGRQDEKEDGTLMFVLYIAVCYSAPIVCLYSGSYQCVPSIARVKSAYTMFGVRLQSVSCVFVVCLRYIFSMFAECLSVAWVWYVQLEI